MRAQSGGAGGRGGGSRNRRTSASGNEYVAGRNPVVEALQADVPTTAVYLQTGLDADERVREALTLANDRGLPILEATRTDLDRLTAAAVH